MNKEEQVYFADFETSADNEEAYVYLGYIKSLSGNNKLFFLNIEDMINWLINVNKYKNNYVYFHNLTWDGEFIIWWLINNNYIPDQDLMDDYSFSEIVNSMGNKMEIKVKIKDKYIVFWDSLKLFPFSVDDIGKEIGIPKLNIDHNKIRIYDNVEQVEQDVIDYVARDVEIIRTKYILYSKNYEIKKTASSSSWNNFKRWYDNKYSSKDFILNYSISKNDYDFLLNWYYGGLTIFNQLYINKEIEDVYYYDINSSYPSIFSNNNLPYGTMLETKPEGEYIEFVNLTIKNLKIKANNYPVCFHNIIKNFSNLNSYLSESTDILNVYYIREEIEVLKNFYDFDIIKEKSYYFKADKKLKPYIDELYVLKQTEKDKIARSDHKLILNSFYGKWGQSYKHSSKKLIVADELIHKHRYKYGKYVYEKFIEEDNNIYYIPIAICITAFARIKLLEAIKDNIDNWLYCDTDSIILRKEAKNLKIDESNLGYWKLEGHFKKFKFLKQKCYILEDQENKLKITAAGINKSAKEKINFSNFQIGNIIEKANKKKKKIKGGCIIEEQDTTL